LKLLVSVGFAIIPLSVAVESAERHESSVCCGSRVRKYYSPTTSVVKCRLPSALAAAAAAIAASLMQMLRLPTLLTSCRRHHRATRSPSFS